MKKALFIYVTVLAALFIVLSWLGRGSAYNAEKVFYGAMETLRGIEKNPDVAPPMVLASAEKALRKVLDDYPKSPSANMAYPELVELLMKQRKYDEAIAVSDEMILKKPDTIALVTKALFARAVCHEKKNEWAKALVDLEILKSKYINTPLGLQAPFYAANHYLRENGPEKSGKYFDEAIAFYKGLMKSSSGTTLGYAASDMLVQVYIYTGKWEEAGMAVTGIISEYPADTAMIHQAPYIELIYVKSLKRPEKARELFVKIIEKTGDERIKQYFDAAIKKLGTS
ncbi:MAG: hypothetical protein HQL30_09725 [Candidatus Omnitrophica bacterium]|nr:hypothetical protein [Candidatus Omnitrophota bacterium]